jgi:hypothetical protein
VKVARHQPASSLLPYATVLLLLQDVCKQTVVLTVLSVLLLALPPPGKLQSRQLTHQHSCSTTTQCQRSTTTAAGHTAKTTQEGVSMCRPCNTTAAVLNMVCSACRRCAPPCQAGSASWLHLCSCTADVQQLPDTAALMISCCLDADASCALGAPCCCQVCCP